MASLTAALITPPTDAPKTTPPHTAAPASTGRRHRRHSAKKADHAPCNSFATPRSSAILHIARDNHFLKVGWRAGSRGTRTLDAASDPAEVAEYQYPLTLFSRIGISPSIPELKAIYDAGGSIGAAVHTLLDKVYHELIAYRTAPPHDVPPDARPRLVACAAARWKIDSRRLQIQWARPRAHDGTVVALNLHTDLVARRLVLDHPLRLPAPF